MTGYRRLTYFRKLYAFTVERHDVFSGRWERYGSVLLPDNAYREELARALLVFDLRMPRGTDRVHWDYDAFGWVPGDARSPLPRPRVLISNVEGRPLARLTVMERKKVQELGQKKL